jgi:ABC-type transporter Mla subunit MlaD
VRRALGIGALAAALAVALLLVLRGGGDEGSYLVRAEFRNAFTVSEGEDVKIAGVTVGRIRALDVTERQTAAVVLDITEPGFQDFRRDAECTIRPQSLIGEKFVECTPTRPREPGAPPAPPLREIEVDGERQRLLPVTNTSRPVDLDLVNNTLRLPYRQRLSLILNEFGAALAGRGEDLRRVIRTADPALKETDEVLEILAEQNEQLADLARDADTALEPLARERERVGSFVTNANSVAQATADRSPQLEESLRRLPRFLRELQPTMERLEGVSGELTPVLSDLRAAAPGVNRTLAELGDFSEAGIPAFRTLGDALDVGRPALLRAKPIVDDLRELGAGSRVLAEDLGDLTESLRDTGGIERLMDFLYYGVASSNGYDATGHYLRAQLLVNLCSTYNATANDPSCTANFRAAEDEEGEEADEEAEASAARARPQAGPPAPAPAPAAAPVPADEPSRRSTEKLLEYLLGSEG